MNALLVVTLLSVAAMLLWGVSDYLAGRSGRKLNGYVTNYIIQVVGLVVMTPIVMAYGFSFSSWSDAGVLLVMSLLSTAAYLLYIRALAIGPVGVAAPIGNSYSVVTLAISLAFFGVTLSDNVLTALLLVVVGAVLLSADKQLLQGKVLHSRTVKLAAMPMLLWGVSFALLNAIVDTNEWYEILFLANVLAVIWAALLVLICAPREKHQLYMFVSRGSGNPMASGLLLALGAIAFFVASGMGGNVVIPAVIASASPLVTSAAAFVMDREKLSVMNRAGAVLVVCGVVLMNL